MTDLKSAWEYQFCWWGQDLGYWLHVLFAMVYLAGAGGPIATVELLSLPVLATWLLRLHGVLPLAWLRLKQPVCLFMLAWCAWMLIAMLWSPDHGSGWHELSNARWAWTMVIVYPVMDRRRWLIAALCLGVALGNVAQLLEWIGHRMDMEWLVWPHPPNPEPVTRISGWWHHPVMGGIVLVGALGLHIGPALLGRGWMRWAGVAGSVVCIVGILATGTRSAWLGAAALIGLVVLAMFVTLPTKRALVAFAAAAIGLAGIAGIGWFAASDQIAYRFDAGVTEIRQAWRGENLSSDMGARLRYAKWAMEAIREHPLRGVGTGGYEHYVRDSLPRWNMDPATTRVAPQAHNTVLHAWATTGIVGMLLCVGLVTSAVWMGIRSALATAVGGSTDRRRAVAAWLGTYSAGPTVGLVGIAIMSAFDVPYVNIQPAGFTSALLALTVAGEWRDWQGRASGLTGMNRQAPIV